MVVYNDVGAMHSGLHRTWVLEWHWFLGRKIVAETELARFQLDSADTFPIKWSDNDEFVILPHWARQP